MCCRVCSLHAPPFTIQNVYIVKASETSMIHVAFFFCFQVKDVESDRLFISQVPVVILTFSSTKRRRCSRLRKGRVALAASIIQPPPPPPPASVCSRDRRALHHGSLQSRPLRTSSSLLALFSTLINLFSARGGKRAPSPDSWESYLREKGREKEEGRDRERVRVVGGKIESGGREIERVREGWREREQ